jgi:DNA-binding response OmpR family regulator
MTMAVIMRILVIEDEQKVSALLKRGLTSERYALDVAADGIEGLDSTEAYPYDLMILDLMVPRIYRRRRSAASATQKCFSARFGSYRTRFD